MQTEIWKKHSTISNAQRNAIYVDNDTFMQPDLVVHRLTGDGPRNLLLAPLWSTDKKRVLNTIHHRLKERDTWQGRLFIS